MRKDIIKTLSLIAVMAVMATGLMFESVSASTAAQPPLERPVNQLVARDYFYGGYARMELSELADLNWNGWDEHETLIVERHFYKQGAQPEVIYCWRRIVWFELEKAQCVDVNPDNYEVPELFIPYFSRDRF